MKIFIYKPYCELSHKIKFANVNPELCWTTKGVNFIEHQNRESKIKEFNQEMAKRYKPTKQQDYWR